MARERSLRIRPFSDAYDEIWSLLSATELRIGDTPYSQGRHSLSDTMLRAVTEQGAVIEVDIDLERAAACVEAADLDLRDLRLSVYVFTQFTNLGRVVFSSPLHAIAEVPVTLTLNDDARPDEDPLRAVHTGFVVRCVLTLDRDIEAVSSELVPTKRHAIVAEVAYRFLSATAQVGGLEVHRLTQVVREREHIPDKTLVYAQRAEAGPHETRVLSEVMTVYMDERVLDKIQAAPNHVESKLQQALLHEAILSNIAVQSLGYLIAERAHGRQMPTIDDLKGTLIAALIKVVAKKGQSRTGARIAPAALLQELVDDTSRFLARLQAVTGLRNASDASFEGNED